MSRSCGLEQGHLGDHLQPSTHAFHKCSSALVISHHAPSPEGLVDPEEPTKATRKHGRWGPEVRAEPLGERSLLHLPLEPGSAHHVPCGGG